MLWVCPHRKVIFLVHMKMLRVLGIKHMLVNGETRTSWFALLLFHGVWLREGVGWIQEGEDGHKFMKRWKRWVCCKYEWPPVCNSVGEGNGNPLQYSCLENPVDSGAWWAAVYGVAQSRTRLKQLSMHACIGEGNGNPLQCSCLENPRDGGAWWAARL